MEINAEPQSVWSALTDPHRIKQYFFNTDVKSEWIAGQPITFSGEFNGTSFTDKGTIITAQPCHVLKYDYWSGFSGLEDIPENYSIVTYEFEDLNGATHLMLTQEGFANIESRDHSESAWEMVLDGLKEIVEA